MNGANPQASQGGSLHDKAMAESFLAGLDPSAEKFAFQVDGPEQKRSRIVHATLDEIWRVVEALNIPAKGCSVFVLPNFPTPRALIAHATNDEQIDRALAAITACGAKADLIVEDGGRFGICYVCSDIPLKQLTALQKDLSAKLGTDPAIMPRVRLPGTLNLENPTKPQLVKLLRNGDIKSRKLDDLLDKLDKLGLPPAQADSASDIDTRTVAVTFFPDKSAQSQRCANLTLPQLAEQIRLKTGRSKL